MSPDLPFQLTFAGRLGGAFNSGTFSFFQANTLSGGFTPEFIQNLRGFSRTRFIVGSSFYYNLEIRSEVFPYRIGPFASQFGILVLKDAGRVWVQGERSREWHHGNGGGLWTSVMKRFVLSAAVARSAEGNFIYVNNDFSF